MCNIKISDGFAVFGGILKKGFSPDAVTFTCLIKGLCGEKKILESRELFKKMVAFGCRPNVITYTTLIHGLCCVGDWEKCKSLFILMMDQDRIGDAREVFDSTTRKGYRPNVVCYTTLINWCCKNRNIYKALYLYRNMISEGIRPDVITYNTLITGLFLNALEMFNTLVDDKFAVDLESLSSLIDRLYKTGRFETAWELFQKIFRQENLVSKVVTYAILINALCKNGQLEKANELFSNMEEKVYAPNVFTFNMLSSRIMRVVSLSGEHYLTTLKYETARASASCGKALSLLPYEECS
ncbi:putative pentatricopeptide repeat-containing protein At3g16710, mitochondrial [Pistacia vera]|uniref:putative pentatricopeptide repeat-containing protein At3g16710, mitochondrial n=1 Tax=Pistacia vera TaxID=55513 RepID=UPI00126360DD|nr:putative pentatricopeptide repeat-containing protein At3g16710, mitochondrial [Pistacia vera]